MLVGYARVSTQEQTLNPQIDALKTEGCEKIFSDIASGAKTQRPGLDKTIEYCRKKDTLVVWKLDRLGRSMSHLLETIKQLEKKEISFKSITEKIDTLSAGGRLIFHLFGALAEFERDLIRERVQTGLKSARARGRLGGRPPVAKETIKLAKILMADKSLPIKKICERLGIGRATLYKYAGPQS